MQVTETNQSQIQCLLIQCAQEIIAIKLDVVQEILEFQDLTLTPVPMLCREVLGVINLRGTVIPVMDLTHMLELPETAINGKACVLVTNIKCGRESLLIGLLVNCIYSIQELLLDDTSGEPSFGTSLNKELIEHMLKHDDKFYPLLNACELFDFPDIQHRILKQL